MTGAETTGNRQLAARAKDLADQAAPGTLATTKSLAAARDVLTGWDGPSGVRAAAVTLLEQLASPAQPEE